MQGSGSAACPHRDVRRGLSGGWGMFPAQLPPSFSQASMRKGEKVRGSLVLP